MEKENLSKIKSDKKLVSQKKDYFMGETVLHDISKAIGVKDQKVYFAGFRKGARTKLHYHEGGQILVITEGKGELVMYEKTSSKNGRIRMRLAKQFNLKVGDMVYIPRYTLHWHGAFGKRNFSHIAFNTFSKKGKEAKTTWYESDFKSYAIKIV